MLNFRNSLALLSLSAVGMVTLLPAHAQDGNPQEQEATRFYTQIINSTNNPLIAEMARESLQKLQQSNSHNTPTGLTENRRVVVELMEQPDSSLAVPGIVNREVMGTFLVDTGSSYTVITPRLAKKLGIVITPETPRISIITANGHIKAPLVTVRQFAIGQLEVPEIQVVVQDLGQDLLLSGLIGMNFFKGMDLAVKQNRLIVDVRVPTRVLTSTTAF